MSRFCSEPKRGLRGYEGECGNPAMARWKDRWVCYGCLEELEKLAKEVTPPPPPPSLRKHKG